MAAAATSGSVAADSGLVGPTEMEGSLGFARPNVGSGGPTRVVEPPRRCMAGDDQPRLATMVQATMKLPPRPAAPPVMHCRLARQAWRLRKDLEAPQVHASPSGPLLFR